MSKPPKFYSFISICILTLASSLLAQVQPEETLLEEQAESSEQSELLEIILELRESPVDINEAEFEELRRIPFLTDTQIHDILAHRSTKGRFVTVAQLRDLPGMGPETFESIEPLVIVTSKTTGRRILQVALRSRMEGRLDQPRGYEDGTYESGTNKNYNRMRFNIDKHITGGFLIERDSGERRFDDLRLFFLSIKTGKHVIFFVGHYLLEIGQGLTLWGPYGFSKSANTISPIKKRGRGIRGYLSVDENAALFGGASQISYGPVEFVAFFSQNRLDATLASENAVSNLSVTGLHRNKNELEKKDVVTETVVGGSVRFWPQTALTFGATYYTSAFDKPITNPDLERNRFDFRGEDNSVASFDFNWLKNPWQIFGEIARSQNGGTALLLGSILDFDTIKLALLHRNYDRDFQNLHGFGFAESNGTTQNERGYYFGLRYRLTRSTTLDAYYDIFSKPWRSFFEPQPTHGNDFFIQFERKFSARTRLAFRIRQKTKQENFEITDELQRQRLVLVSRKKSQFRVQLDFSPMKNVSMRSRFEITNLNYLQGGPQLDPETGMLVYQDIRFQPGPWAISVRLTFFDTDSFDSRMFQYEHDLPGVVTNRALFGRGTRRYVLLKYNLLTPLSLYLKYSETYRDDTDTIGTGPDQIDGNLDRRIGFQAELRIR